MAKVDELVVEIKGKIDDLTDKLDKAVSETKKASDSMGGAFSHLSGKLGKVTTGFGAFGLAVQGVQSAMAPLGTIIDNLNKAGSLKLTADRVRVNTTSFQELAYAARTVGVDADGLADAMKDLGVKITDTALNGGALEDALNAIGVDAKELAALKPDEQFLAFADAISKAGDNVQDFGLDEINDQMYQLAPLMRGGRAEFEKLAKAAHDAGRVLSESELSELKDAQKAARDLGEAWQGVFDQLTLIIANPLTKMMDMANDTLTILNKAIKLSKESGLAEDIAASQKTGPLGSGGVQVGEVEHLPTGEDFFKKMQREAQGLPALTEDEVQEAKQQADLFEGQMTGEGGIFGGQAGTKAADFEEEARLEEEQLLKIEEMKAESLERAKILEAQYKAERIQEKLDEEAQKAEIDKKAKEDELERQKRLEAEREKQKRIAFRKLGSLMNSESRKMFEIGKAAKIAEVAVETPKAAMAAFSAMQGIPVIGPALGAAAAGAAIAYGAQQIQQIKSTSFRGGGGGGSAPSAGGGGGATGGASAEPQEVVQRTDVAVTLVGDNFGGDGVVNLIDRLNDAVGDGATLRATQLG